LILSQKQQFVPAGVELLRLHMPIANPANGGKVLHLFDPEDIKEVDHGQDETWGLYYKSFYGRNLRIFVIS
jgi:hypothetical protein